MYTTTILIAEYTIATVLMLNTVFHFCRYIWISLTLKPVALSPRQKSLLGVRVSGEYHKRVLSCTASECNKCQI